jgi:hypothetical protein
MMSVMRFDYSRQLVETQDEMGEMKNKLRVLEHQSHQLKEEVAAREAAVVKEHLDCLKLEKERDAQLAEIMLLKNHQKTVEKVSPTGLLLYYSCSSSSSSIPTTKVPVASPLLLLLLQALFVSCQW